MSSLFSSSSLALNESASKSSTSPTQSRYIESSSTSPITPATPVKGSPTPRKVPTLNGKGAPPPDELSNGIHKIRLGSDAVSADGRPIPPEKDSAFTASPTVPNGTSPNTAESPVRRNGAVSTKRTPSQWSQWEPAEAAEESSDEEEDDEAFATPSEGLSEVEEEDEDAVDPNLDKTNVAKGTSSSASKDIAGTGKSTIRRHKPSGEETRVKKRLATTKVSALSFDQDGSLGTDLEVCRQVLTLFLTSKMKEAEALCYEKDPDANHLYLLSANGIINGLKVSFLTARLLRPPNSYFQSALMLIWDRRE